MGLSEPEIEAELRRQLEARGPEKTICPSEVARALGTGAEWRALMGPVRDVAAQLADAGEVEFSQGGTRIDPHHFRGAIRLRLLEP